MAQTGYTPILIYSSSTTTNAPSAGNLTNSTLGSELAINITDGKLFYKDNANAVQVIAWKTTPTTAGGTGLTSYTAGDLLYYASGTTLTKLAIGASTTIMTSSGTAPQWSAASGITVGTATNIAGGAAGSVPYQSGAGATTFVSIGSAYQALQVNAGGTAPSWQASATSTLTTQGDLLYASAANTLARLAKNTSATRYLSNTGSSNNPAWAQVDLTNGVTGTLPTTSGGTGLTSFTANGVVYASSTSALTTGAGLKYDGNFGIGTTTLYSNAAFTSLNVGGSQSGKVGFIGLFNASDTLQATLDTYNNTFRIGTNGTTNPIIFYLGGTVQETLKLDSSSNVTVSVGNLIVGTSGKGIDFSANSHAAGMTSELLDWYEEGTWTPTLTCSDGAFTSVTYDPLRGGSYTRVGNVVHLQCYMRTDAVDNTVGRTGDVLIAGLPFTAVSGTGGTLSGHCSLAVSFSSTWAGEEPLAAFISGGDNNIQLLYRTAVDGNTSNNVAADVGTGANANIVLIGGTYICA